MAEVEATVAFEAGEGEEWRPVRLRHRRLGLWWTVREVLAAWTHPGWPEKTYGHPIIERRYKLRVWGPLPWTPARRGEFTLVATSYGDRPVSWWIRPEQVGRQGLEP